VYTVSHHYISSTAPVTRLNLEVESNLTPTLSPPAVDLSNYGEYHRLPPQHHRYGGDQRHETAHPEHPRRITFVEGAPRKMRCVAGGGFPLPEMQITVGTRDVTNEFTLSHSVTLDGIQGLRSISYLTERTTDKIAFTSRDDGLPIKCVVSVPGLTPNETQVHISVLREALELFFLLSAVFKSS